MRRIVYRLIALGLVGGACVFGVYESQGVRAQDARENKAGEVAKDGDIKPNENAKRVVEGNYLGEGTTGGGIGRYKTKVSIKRVKDTYVLTWKMTNEAYEGIGIVEGDRLCVSCVMGGRPCVVVYKIKDDGTLEGKWSVQPGVIDTEVLVPDVSVA